MSATPPPPPPGAGWGQPPGPPPGPGSYPPGGPPAKKGPNPWLIGGIVAAVVAALVIGAVVLLGGDDDDDDDVATDRSSTTTEAEDSDPTTSGGSSTTTSLPGGADAREGIEEFTDELDDLGAGGGAPEYTEYTSITDDSGTLTMEVPVEWSDVDGTVGSVGPDIRAATDLPAFATGFDEPGAFFTAKRLAPGETSEAVLTQLLGTLPEQCTPLSVDPYDDGTYAGVSQVLEECAGTDTAIVGVAASPAEGGIVTIVLVQVVDERDLEALTRVLESFVVIGTL